jgi:hypothetical protein
LTTSSTADTDDDEAATDPGDTDDEDARDTRAATTSQEWLELERSARSDQGQCAAHSVNTGGAMAANKSVRAVRGPPNTQQPHAARVRAPTLHAFGPPRPSRQRQSPFQRCLLCRTSVGCAPPRQPWKATCDLSAGASQQAMARSSQGTAAAMRARISGPPSRIRRTRHGERVDECTSASTTCCRVKARVLTSSMVGLFCPTSLACPPSPPIKSWPSRNDPRNSAENRRHRRELSSRCLQYKFVLEF